MRLGLDFLKFFPVEVVGWSSDDLLGPFHNTSPQEVELHVVEKMVNLQVEEWMDSLI